MSEGERREERDPEERTGEVRFGRQWNPLSVGKFLNLVCAPNMNYFHNFLFCNSLGPHFLIS